MRDKKLPFIVETIMKLAVMNKNSFVPSDKCKSRTILHSNVYVSVFHMLRKSMVHGHFVGVSFVVYGTRRMQIVCL